MTKEPNKKLSNTIRTVFAFWRWKDGNVLRAFCVSLLIPFILACTGLVIFAANYGEMNGTVLTLLPILGLAIAAVTAILFLVQLPFLYVKKNWFTLINAALLTLGGVLWLQANVFNWNLGQLDGRDFQLWNYWHLGLLECICFALMIVIAIKQYKVLSRYTVHIVCILAVAHSAQFADDFIIRTILRETLSIETKVFIRKTFFGIKPVKHDGFNELSYANPDATDVTFPHNTNISTWKQYQISYSKLFEFSEKQNVILIVSDAFANYLFLNQLEEHPEFKEQFKDFTFFTNMMTYGHTSYSIPQMLTGCDVDKIPPITDSLKYDRFLHETFNQPQSLLKSLATDGYRIDATFHTPGVLYCNSDWISNLKPIPHDKKSLLDKINDSGFLDVCYFTSLRVLPIFLKPLITSYIDRESQKTHEQSEHYEKLPLLRFDYSFANDLREYPVHISNENKTFKFYFLRGLHFPGEFNEKFNFEKIPPTQEERRAYAQLLLFQEIIRQLKEKGCYDNSLIIYTADHGLWCGKDAVSVIDPVHSVRPLLLIKKINETHKEMVVDQTYCSTQDITPTILSELSLPFTATNNSCSVFNMTEEMQIYRKAIFNDVTKWGYVHPQPSKTATGILLNNVKLTQVSDKIKSDYKKTALSRSRIKPSGDNFQISIGNEIKSWRDSPPKSVQIVLQSSSSGDNNNYTGNAVIINKPKFVACWTCTAEIDVSTLKTGEYDISYILSYRGNSYRYYSAGQKVTIDNNKVVNIYNPIQK